MCGNQKAEGCSMTAAIHKEAERLVRERKAPDYRAACSVIAKRQRPKPSTPSTRELPANYRPPYADD